MLLLLVGLVGLQFEGRLGASFNFDFLVAHFLAIFGICDQSVPGVCSAAEGVGQRLGWWTNIFQRMAQDPFSLLLGLGYGVALTDFYGSSGAAVREPHNSYVTVHRPHRHRRRGLLGADHAEHGPALAPDVPDVPRGRAGARARTGCCS